MDIANAEIKKVYKMTDEQAEKSRIILTCDWALNGDNLFFKEEDSMITSKFAKCKTQYTNYSTYVNCFNDSNDEFCFIFPNNRFKYHLKDRYTTYERNTLLNKLTETDIGNLHKIYISQLESNIGNQTLENITVSDRIIHDEILSNYVECK